MARTDVEAGNVAWGSAPFADFVGTARGYEPERYLAATLAQEPERAALIAIAFYAAELTHIVQSTTQPMLGEIRLQWWRDALDTTMGGALTGNPAADALGHAIQRFAIPVPMLLSMSEARAWDLYGDPMPDEASLEGYLAKTEAVPFELALRVLGVSAGHAGPLAARAGRAFGLTRLLASWPAKYVTGRLALPLTVLARFGLTPDTLNLESEAGARQMLERHLCSEIVREYETIRPQFRALTRPQRTALLTLATIPPYLNGIARQSNARRRDTVELAPLTRVWRIAAAHMLGRI